MRPVVDEQLSRGPNATSHLYLDLKRNIGAGKQSVSGISISRQSGLNTPVFIRSLAYLELKLREGGMSDTP
jgi:hypothetical protein